MNIIAAGRSSTHFAGPPGEIGPDGFPGRRGEDGDRGEEGEIGDKGVRVRKITCFFFIKKG